MSFETPIKVSLQKDDKAFGFWLTIPHTAIVRTVLHSSPPGTFSWVLLDAEHGLVTDKDYYDLANAVAAEGVSPIIRVPFGEEWMIKRALDAGAHGIVTPMCHTEIAQEDAARIVKFSKYPPTGSRGYGPMFANHTLPGVPSGPRYDQGQKDGLLVIVQIETAEGLENVEKIAQVDGVDVLFVGPFDLAKQNGLVHGSAEHETAIARILEATKAAGKVAAIFCSNGEQARARSEQGFDMISIVTDGAVLTEGMLREYHIAASKTASTKPREGY